MMKKLFSLSISLLFSLALLAQAPDLINYQAVARDGAGVPLINTAVTVQFDIRQSNPTGTIVYSETHSSSTNPFGLFTLQIGGGTPVSGTFAGINWSTGLYYLQVTVNGDAMAPSQLLSVPYALHANTASSGTPGANGHNGLSAITTEPAGANCPNGGYLVDVGVDDNDDGTLQALEIDFSYYVCNGLDGAANTSDTSATNELQTLSISNDTVFLSNGGFVVLPPALGDNWGSQVVLTSGPNLTGDGTIATPLMVIDNDSSATNELQNLTIAGNNINITNGTGAQLSATAPNTGDYLYWNGVNWVSQAPAANTDNQNLINGGKAGNIQTVNIQNGTGINFSVADGDSVATNEIQQLSFSNPTLSLSLGGGSVNMSGLNTDAQTLNYVSASQTLSISNGNSVTLVVDDADADPTNEHNTGFAVNGGNLEITDGGGTLQVPLTNLSDGDWTTNATHLENANTGNVGIGPMLPSGPGYFLSTRKALTVAAINAYSAGDPAQVEIVGSSTNANDVSGRLAFGHITAGPTSVYEGGIEMNVGSEMMFQTGGATERMRITSAGAVGIGTANPLARFVVAGGNMILRDQTDVVDAVELTSGVGPGASGSIGLRNSGINRVFLTGVGASWFNAGLVGIGTNAPTYSALDVNGQITQRTGAAAGYIPVSDANGTMTWTDPTTIGTADDGDWLRYNNGTYDYLINDNTHRVRVLDPTSGSGNIQSNQNTFEIYANGGDRAMEVNVRNVAIGDIDAGGAGANIFVDGDGSGDIQLNNFGTTALIVKNSGRIGIGQPNPAVKVDVLTTTDLRAGQFIQNFTSNSTKYGLYATAQGAGAGDNRGVQGEASGPGVNYGVYGRALFGTANWAGYFENGDVHVQNDFKVGSTAAGTYNPKVLISTTTGDYTSIEADNQYNGNQTMYGFYNRQIASGTGGMAGTWHYMTPSASSSSNVYGFRSLILDGGNGDRYGSYHYVHADGSGEVNGVYSAVNHDGTGEVYGLRTDVSASTTTGTVRPLWVVGTLNSTSYIGSDLGVGVQTPQNRLDVEGAAVIGATYSGTNTAPGNGLLVAGQTGIGTTTPVARLQVSEPGGGDAVFRGQVGGTTYSMIANNGNTALYYNLTPAYRLTLNTNSAAKPTSSTWTVASDARLKTKVSQFNDGLNVLMKINPVWFNYTGEAGMPTDERGVGTLAQELQKIAPYMVHEWQYQEGSTEETEGRPTLGTTKSYLGVDYGAMDFVLINAIKEQQKMIEELKKEIEELKLKQQ